MGVSGLLPRLLPSVGRRVDLRSVSDGVPAEEEDVDVDDDGRRRRNRRRPPPSRKRTRSERRRKRRRSDGDGESPTMTAATTATTRKKRRRTRKVRVGIDASGWIARACHGHGSTLLDERHLSNYGRSELLHRRGGGNVGNDGPEGGGGGGDGDVGPSSNALDASRLALEGRFVRRCASYVLERVRRLRDGCGLDVLVVLDGASPPAKESVRRDRRERREEAADRRDRKIDERGENGAGGNDGVDVGVDADADEEEAETIDRIRAAKRAGGTGSSSSSSGGGRRTALLPAVVSAVLSDLRNERIPFLVSPYESDGQLAYLSKKRFVDLVVTDDSDLIGLGARDVLYKVDVDSCSENDGNGGGGGGGGFGTGVLLRRSELGASPPPLSFLDFTDVMLAATFVAAGCDYCDSLRGVGIVTARNVVEEAFRGTTAAAAAATRGGGGDVGGDDTRRRRRRENGRTAAGASRKEREKGPSVLRKVFEGLYSGCYDGRSMSDDDKARYESNFLSALVAYRHPIVFDPVRGECVMCNVATGTTAPTTGARPCAASEDDERLREYRPYDNLCSDRTAMEKIVGKIHVKTRSVQIAEGWVDPWTGRLRENVNVPERVLREYEADEGDDGRRRPADAAEGSAVVIASSTPSAVVEIDDGQSRRREGRSDDRDGDVDAAPPAAASNRAVPASTRGGGFDPSLAPADRSLPKTAAAATAGVLTQSGSGTQPSCSGASSNLSADVNSPDLLVRAVPASSSREEGGSPPLVPADRSSPKTAAATTAGGLTQSSSGTASSSGGRAPSSSQPSSQPSTQPSCSGASTNVSADVNSPDLLPRAVPASSPPEGRSPLAPSADRSSPKTDAAAGLTQNSSGTAASSSSGGRAPSSSQASSQPSTQPSCSGASSNLSADVNSPDLLPPSLPVSPLTQPRTTAAAADTPESAATERRRADAVENGGGDGRRTRSGGMRGVIERLWGNGGGAEV